MFLLRKGAITQASQEAKTNQITKTIKWSLSGNPFFEDKLINLDTVDNLESKRLRNITIKEKTQKNSLSIQKKKERRSDQSFFSVHHPKTNRSSLKTFHQEGYKICTERKFYKELQEQFDGLKSLVNNQDQFSLTHLIKVKQQYISGFLEQFIEKVKNKNKTEAIILADVFNFLFNLSQECLQKLAKYTHLNQMNNLQELTEVHQSYQEKLTQIYQQVKQCKRQIQEKNKFMKILVQKLKQYKKQMKKMDSSMKMASQKLNQFKQGFVEAQIQCIDLMMQYRNISHDNAKMLLDRKIMLGIQRNKQYKVMAPKQKKKIQKIQQLNNQQRQENDHLTKQFYDAFQKNLTTSEENIPIIVGTLIDTILDGNHSFSHDKYEVFEQQLIKDQGLDTQFIDRATDMEGFKIDQQDRKIGFGTMDRFIEGITKMRGTQTISPQKSPKKKFVNMQVQCNFKWILSNKLSQTRAYKLDFLFENTLKTQIMLRNNLKSLQPDLKNTPKHRRDSLKQTENTANNDQMICSFHEEDKYLESECDFSGGSGSSILLDSQEFIDKKIIKRPKNRTIVQNRNSIFLPEKFSNNYFDAQSEKHPHQVPKMLTPQTQQFSSPITIRVKDQNLETGIQKQVGKVGTQKQIQRSSRVSILVKPSGLLEQISERNEQQLKNQNQQIMEARINFKFKKDKKAQKSAKTTIKNKSKEKAEISPTHTKSLPKNKPNRLIANQAKDTLKGKLKPNYQPGQKLRINHPSSFSIQRNESNRSIRSETKQKLSVEEIDKIFHGIEDQFRNFHKNFRNDESRKKLSEKLYADTLKIFENIIQLIESDFGQATQSGYTAIQFENILTYFFNGIKQFYGVINSVQLCKKVKNFAKDLFLLKQKNDIVKLFLFSLGFDAKGDIIKYRTPHNSLIWYRILKIITKKPAKCFKISEIELISHDFIFLLRQICKVLALDDSFFEKLAEFSVQKLNEANPNKKNKFFDIYTENIELPTSQTFTAIYHINNFIYQKYTVLLRTYQPLLNQISLWQSSDQSQRRNERVRTVGETFMEAVIILNFLSEAKQKKTINKMRKLFIKNFEFATINWGDVGIFFLQNGISDFHRLTYKAMGLFKLSQNQITKKCLERGQYLISKLDLPKNTKHLLINFCSLEQKLNLQPVQNLTMTQLQLKKSYRTLSTVIYLKYLDQNCEEIVNTMLGKSISAINSIFIQHQDDM